jgi:hypothetical protein
MGEPMRKNVLFLVHGVGVHADDWATKTGGPVETLKMAYSGYQTSAGADLDDRMEFVPIRYDDIFDKVLNRWQEMSHGIGVNLPIAQRISELLDESGGNASTAIRYGADVLLYWGLPVVARAVRLRVMVALTGKVSSRDSGTAVPHYGVLGHSLGTTVVHDALHHLATDRWLDDDDEALELVAPSDAERDALVSVADRTGKNPYSPESEFRWRAIYMVAPTSRWCAPGSRTTSTRSAITSTTSSTATTRSPCCAASTHRSHGTRAVAASISTWTTSTPLTSTPSPIT